MFSVNIQLEKYSSWFYYTKKTKYIFIYIIWHTKTTTKITTKIDRTTIFSTLYLDLDTETKTNEIIAKITPTKDSHFAQIRQICDTFSAKLVELFMLLSADHNLGIGFLSIAKTVPKVHITISAIASIIPTIKTITNSGVKPDNATASKVNNVTIIVKIKKTLLNLQ